MNNVQEKSSTSVSRFSEICRIEPKIKEMLWFADDDLPKNRPNETWYGSNGLKRIIETLVGAKASNPLLRDPKDYWIVEKEFMKVLIDGPVD